MLQSQTMFDELERFSDPLSATFAGSPTSRDDARQRWAHAFRVYFAQVIDVVGSPLTPPDGSIQPTFAGDVEQAFQHQIQLDPSMTARAAAEDFADAWRAAMRAVHAGAGGTIPPSAVVYAFVSWTPTAPPRDIVDDRRDVLADELTLLFTAPAIAAATRLHDVADAFHRATEAITATSSIAGAPITFT
jgi:hypothetical protein